MNYLKMLTVSQIRTQKKDIIAGLKKRNYPDKSFIIVDQIIELDDRRKKTQFELDEILSRINTLSKSIGKLYQQGNAQQAEEAKKEVVELKDKSKAYGNELKEVSIELEEHLLSLPNIPHESVPTGADPEDNDVVQPWPRDLPDFGTDKLPHWELAKAYGIIDFELGTKITGSGFPVYCGKGAKLQRALIQFFLDEAEKAGYVEFIPPLVVNSDSALATGQLPDKEGQMYHVTKDDLYLIPTAEVPLTNIFRNAVMNHSELPVKITGYTPCFRREAGSYGSDVKGLNRLHQFDKIEIVHICEPSVSYDHLNEMVEHVKNLLTKLELPYRILRLCGGDLGFTSALTYDFEVFSAAQKKWLEVSSVSNFETFQSNRLKLRYKDEDGKRHLVHTLNGSALALARVVAALLENNQEPDGIRVPKVLVSYTNFEIIN